MNVSIAYFILDNIFKNIEIINVEFENYFIKASDFVKYGISEYTHYYHMNYKKWVKIYDNKFDIWESDSVELFNIDKEFDSVKDYTVFIFPESWQDINTNPVPRDFKYVVLATFDNDIVDILE